MFFKVGNAPDLYFISVQSVFICKKKLFRLNWKSVTYFFVILSLNHERATIN